MHWLLGGATALMQLTDSVVRPPRALASQAAYFSRSSRPLSGRVSRAKRPLNYVFDRICGRTTFLPRFYRLRYSLSNTDFRHRAYFHQREVTLV